MSWNFDELQSQVKEEIGQAADAKALEACRIKYLGRKGILADMFASLSTLPADQRPEFGKRVNELRGLISQLLDEKAKSAPGQSQQGSRRKLDPTLPANFRPLGHTHVLTHTIEEICHLFERMGFVVHDGPEMETEFHNFTALNIPVDHPSRDAFDTFYLNQPDPQKPGRHLLLRSHTSPGQIRIMKKYKPPFAVIIPGKVYRPDAVDASHSFMFHQIEGLLVTDRVQFSELKGLLTRFCQQFFGEDIEMRFRPHFFPFTEPSAEVDISWKKGRKGWLEIMGCGMVHPRVFEAAGYPKGKYMGLAFGLGVERIAMLKHGINDIRIFSENDQRFLKQF